MVKATRQVTEKFYERASKLDPTDLNDIMKWCYYSIKAGLHITEKRLRNFGVNSEKLKNFKDKNILSLMKDGKTYFFSAYEYCKGQAEKFGWDKEIDKREPIKKQMTDDEAFWKLMNGDFEVEEGVEEPKKVLVSASDDIWMTEEECKELGIPIPE